MSELNFTAFVISLATSAAIHLGDKPSPDTGRTGAPNLEGASQMIEILSLLDIKTKGNLTVPERQVLERVLLELRMRYVEVAAAIEAAGRASDPGHAADGKAGVQRG